LLSRGDRMRAAEPRIVLPYATFGPYHVARVRHAGQVLAARGLRLIPVELFESSDTYRWNGVTDLDWIARLNLPRSRGDNLPLRYLRKYLAAIARLQPRVAVINGWATRQDLGLHFWCWQHRIPRVLISDSQERDSRRWGIIERAKRIVVCGSDAAFTAGQPQARYLQSLGMPPERCFLGCDVVDNDHFSGAAEQRKWSQSVLTVARFEPSKNLVPACEAFLEFAGSRPAGEDWSWTLVGYGSLDAKLGRFAAASRGKIRVLSYKSYDELPAIYASASLYWQPSVQEPWGLVVNEAMSAGMPVLVSLQCGCQEDLVAEDSGWVFDPYSHTCMVRALTVAAESRQRWPEMGAAAQRRIRRWGLDRFGDGLTAAVRAALRHGSRASSRNPASMKHE
jgi:1,2-diacylglycerol 3-alpha-glucosyltransferase